MKKAFSLLLALCMVVCLCACGTVKTTSTTTTTTTDANGNTTTTTTTTTNSTNSVKEGSCAAAAQDGEEHTVSVSIENATGEDMNGIYVCVTGATEWGNLLSEDEYLADGSTATDYVLLTYTADSMSFDLGIKNAADELIEFDPIDISNLSADGFTITFSADGWTAK